MNVIFYIALMLVVLILVLKFKRGEILRSEMPAFSKTCPAEKNQELQRKNRRNQRKISKNK
jgi:hypothetical protein